jgi:peptidyl-prolyl cis-trans isomerase C
MTTAAFESERKLMKPRLLAAATAFALALPAAALAQAPALPTKEPAKPAAPASKEGPVATVNGVAIPRSRSDLFVQQQVERGNRDSEQLRAQVREVLINNEVVYQEATRAGFPKRTEVQQRLELLRHEVIVNAYVADWLRKNPVAEADIQKEYDRARSLTGDKEYKARHILLESEDAAKGAIADIAKGAKFEEVAQKLSKDEGTRPRGGELEWSVPGNYDKAFADAMVKLEKGKMTTAPVRSRFGYHVIRLDDVRELKFPALDEVKPQIQQRLTQQKIEALVRELRAKAKIQ